MSLWHELRERRVVEWGVGYAAAAWGVLEAVDVLGDHFAWPAALFRFVAVSAATGFPLTVVLAWYHGKHGRQRTTRVEAVLLGMILLLGVGSGWLLRAPGASEAAESNALARSIAVLPFTNLSSSDETEYFSDGVTQEIMHALAQVPGLWVAARTSSFAFKGRSLPAREIARQLGVRQLLDGTVRREGDRVRIAVQLVDAPSGRALWSEQYDRLITDIFAIQAEISRRVAQQLQLRSVLASDLSERGTRDAEAFDLYLRGLYAMTAELDYRGGHDYFQQAVARDSTYALALAGLAEAYNQLDEPERAEAAARRALELHADLPEAHTALAFTLAFNRWDWAAAEAELARALELNPNDVLAVQHWAYVYQSTGRNDEAIATIERAQRLDPLSLRIEVDRAIIYLDARRFDRAIEQAERVLRLDPDNGLAPRLLAGALYGAGRVEEAVERWDSLGDSLSVALARADTSRARSILESERASGQLGLSVWTAAAYARIGDGEHALVVLDSLYRRRFRLLYGMASEPWLDGLRADPRFQDLLRKIGLAP